jgi:hypothetical protein
LEDIEEKRLLQEQEDAQVQSNKKKEQDLWVGQQLSSMGLSSCWQWENEQRFVNCCNKSKKCISEVNHSYADKICDPIIGIYENRAIIAQENSNPSGVRNLGVLYESGKAIQQYQLERREANIEFRKKYHRSFPESICKKYAESDE